MICHDVTQGTSQWLKLRAGIPTASCFDEILTGSGKPSTQAERYMMRLLAERCMGRPVIEAISYWQGRGLQMEAEAIAFYEGVRELDTMPIGFVTNDARTIGASPDRFVGDDGLLEIKVPKEEVHMLYLLASLDGRRGVDSKYRQQTQGQLWITERWWLDILSYSPDLPPALIRVERDEDYIERLAAAVTTFSEELERMAIELHERGWIRGEE